MKSSPVPADLISALDTIADALGSGMKLNAWGQTPHIDFPETDSTAGDLPVGDVLAAVEKEALSCQACPLAPTRKNVVFGQGVERPLVLVVGEGPGAEEDNQGLPFVGASGKLLDKMLSAIGLDRQTNCYIANIVKCRPPGNREPAPDERAACLPYLRRQIECLAPKAILCAGRTAAQALLDTPDGINRLRGKRHTYSFKGAAIPVVATYHPSALLRDESLKRPAWEDLKALRDLLNADDE